MIDIKLLSHIVNNDENYVILTMIHNGEPKVVGRNSKIDAS